MQECFLVRTLSLIGVNHLRISCITTNFQVFSLGEHFLLSKHLEAHPRQMQLCMRFLEA